MLNPQAPFWRPDRPLSLPELHLYLGVIQAHHDSSFRGNVSSEAVRLSAIAGGKDFYKAMTAGMAMLGGPHAPLVETYDLLALPAFHASTTKRILDEGGKVPGWGNSFVKGEADPLWRDVDAGICEKFPAHYRTLTRITQVLHAAGKPVYPNPSAYTALTAIILGMPRELTPFLLLEGRLEAWAEIFANSKL